MVGPEPKLRELFSKAAECPTTAEQASYLDQVCQGNAALRAQLEELLQAHREAGSFLQEPSDRPSGAIELPAPAQRPGTVIGPYKLLQQIGEGGMGVVWMAEQAPPVQRKVALKVIKPGMDSRQVIARFEAERQALAVMDHVNIARVFDGGAAESGRPYFVMELVHGVPITKYCDDNHLTPRERLELFVSVCQAIQHAHQKGIIHRDIKPSNVMITLYDGKPVPKVIDFGVAKATEQKLTERTLFTQYGTMVGTLEYMSPEQAEMSALGVDTRSDIYSLGVLLYELLTGSTPLTHKRMKEVAYAEILRMIKEEEPPRPSTRLSDSGAALASISAQRHTEPTKLTKLVRGELDWIVMKTLEKDRNRRYETASAFAADVQHYLRDEPVQACPPSAMYRFRKFARRNKMALATATVVALAFCVAAGTLVVSSIRISGESAEKAKALETATASQQEAQESLKDALAAVDQMLTRVSEERLQFEPQMEPVRRELLQDALKFYQKFLERKSGDPTIRRETALAYRRMGSLHYRLGDYGKAEDACRRAFAMLDELDAQSPLEPDIRTELIFYHIEFSWVLHNQGKNEQKEMALRQAVAVAEVLVKMFPVDAARREHLADASNRLAGAIAGTKPQEAEKILRRNLVLLEDSSSSWHRGQTFQNLGYVLAHQRRFPEAEKACRQGVLFFEKAVAKSPSSRWMQIDLTGTLQQLAYTFAANDLPREAEETCRRAIPILDKLAADFPSGPHYRWSQADVHFQHGLHLKKLKRSAEAEEEYRRAVELFDKLANAFAMLPGYQQTAVNRRHHLARFLAESGRVQEALEVYDQATAILEKLAGAEKLQALKARALFYGGAGQWDKATADFAKAIDLGSDDVMGIWYPLAVLHLRAQHTKEYRTLCERLLKQPRQPEHHFVVIICKLAPNAVADLSQPVQIAEKQVAREPQNAEYIGLLGAALYRKGDVKAAAQKLEEGIRLGPEQIGVHYRKLVLAMAYHRLGRGPEARQLLENVTQWTEQNGPEKLSWAHRLDLQLLHYEAEQFLKQDSGGKSQK
jgi:eukaryotic-like serine/threonine-protein kinase